MPARTVESVFFACLTVLLLGSPALAAEKTIHKPAIPYQKVRVLHHLSSWNNDSLSLPTDVAVYRKRVYVVDGGNSRIVVFDKLGNFQFLFAAEGHQPGQLYYPVGIGVDGKGWLYVADRGNQRIQIFDEEGKFVSGFTLRYKGKPVSPIDVAPSHSGNELYVSVNDNHRLMVFSRKGKLLRMWGKNGMSSGEFRYPASVLLTPEGLVAVVDVLNTRVQLFTHDGDFVREIGGWGVLPGQLVRPKGVAIDKQNRVYVSESYMDLVQSYTDEGRFLKVLKPDTQDQLTTPAGIAIDQQNHLYVSEILKNRITVMQLPP